jgi:alkyl hydroperoxide reductase subunit AhpC
VCGSVPFLFWQQVVSQILTVGPHVFRGLFIIDAKGVLRQITVNDLPVGRSVDEALRLVQAFQYTDEHGEGEYSQMERLPQLCPA